MNLKWLSLPLLTLFVISCTEKELTYIKYVDPFIGTGGTGWSEGRCFPGPVLPYGRVQLSPEVRDDLWTGYYRYDQPTIKGFSHTHLSGSGISEASDITIMPTVGEPRFTPGTVKEPESGYRSRFSKENEIARAGYYSVILDDYNIKAELTATTRTGMHRYTFPETDQANIIIDLRYGVMSDWVIDSWVNVLGDHTIGGFRRTNRWADDNCVYFVAEFSRPFKAAAIVSDSIVDWNIKEAQGGNLQVMLTYNTSEKQELIAKVGISSVSMEGALLNLQTENPGWNFDKVKRRAEEAWEKELSKIEVEGDEEYKTTFYTAFYHTMLGPFVYSDVDGKHRGLDHQEHQVKDRDYYTLFSLWDTYRTLHPLMTITQPERTVDIIKTFIDIYDQGGMLPVWEVFASETYCMMGYHAVSVIADAYRKGIRDFDVKMALTACCSIAEQRELNLYDYVNLGYIPSDMTRWAVSKVLEYAYDDYCIAMLAKEAGEEGIYNTYIKRAQFYKNIFNPETEFFAPRWSDGKFHTKWREDYCEAGPYQYKFYVPHDLETLIDMFGGKDEFVSQLDTLFAKGQYQHDNEPSHHMAFLYNYAGMPWKTQERVDHILKNEYNNTPSGLCGNDDVGQMSAWYVMSALGFYPLCPGTPEYVITTPAFEYASIDVGEGRRFVIEAKGRTRDSKYIKSVSLNGKPYTKSYITHADIMAGGVMSFEVSDTPDKAWGSQAEDCPKSRITDLAVGMPFVVIDNNEATGKKTITLNSITPGADIYYTLDETVPTTSSAKYEKPIEINETTVIKSIGVAEGYNNSLVSTKTVKINHSGYPKIIENIPVAYNHLTAEGGAKNLIDGIIANSTDVLCGSWVFFDGANDMDVTVDLGEIKPVNAIFVNFLQKANFNAFVPKRVEYSVSSDGKTFTSVKVFEFTINPQRDIHEYVMSCPFHLTPAVNTRYVRVKADRQDECTKWNLPFDSANLFADEITIR